MRYTKEQIAELIKKSLTLNEDKSEMVFWLSKINDLSDEQLNKLGETLILESNEKKKIEEETKNRGIEINKKYLHELSVLKSKTFPKRLKEMELSINQNDNPDKILNDLNNI